MIQRIEASAFGGVRVEEGPDEEAVWKGLAETV